MAIYTSLPWSREHRPLHVAVEQVNHNASSLLSWHESARLVLDDFARRAPLQLTLDTELATAELALKAQSLRYALVLDDQHQLTGIVSLRDLHGRKAVQTAVELRCHHAEVPIRYVMTSLNSLPVIDWQRFAAARIGDIAATMKRHGADYVLVERDQVVRGIVTSLGITELTGESVKIAHHAASFADIVGVVAHAAEAD